MAKIAGVDVLVKVPVGSPAVMTAIGGQSGATLNRSAETIDVTAKDSNGWSESLAGVKSWSIECEGFIAENDTALDALETAFNDGKAVTVDLALPSGKKYTGQALITDFPFEFPQDDAATFSLTLTGTGALTEA